MILFVAGCGVTQNAIVDNKKINIEDAKMIAMKKLESIDPASYSNDDLDAVADENNTRWKQHLIDFPDHDHQTLVNSLINRDYWAVYCCSKNKRAKDGSGYVFIDKTTGKVIDFVCW